MHPIISADMKKARVAEFHRRADQDRLARALHSGRRLQHAAGRHPERPGRVVLRLVVAIRTWSHAHQGKALADATAGLPDQ
jgi:hypothetical protein